MQWHQVLNDPTLRNLPFKVELDGLGQLLMSPASNAHGAIQADLSAMLKTRFRRRGRVYAECSIQTHEECGLPMSHGPRWNLLRNTEIAPLFRARPNSALRS